MGLEAGTKLGPYEIVSALGAGGMGEVYRARDTRLERDVAIKVLPRSVAGDGDRLRRFEQEARAVAALDHPNILAVHDIGTHDGSPYLVTELLEGESLRQRLEAGALPQRKAIEYAEQVAQGLAAAHDKGIVHRDLKPENVFLTKNGRVKILDFGLAKLQVAQAAVADGLTIGTQTSPGVVMGTAGYMSPEQVRGATTDHRTDIFSFGSVLYEMLTGRRAFGGETSVETMNAILKEDPPELTTTGLQVSPGLERTIRRCLEKKPEERFQSARDLAFALDAITGASTTISLGVGATRRWAKWQNAVTALAALAVVAAVVITAMELRRQAPERAMIFAIPVRGEIGHMALSLDGRKLVFVSPEEGTGKNVLYLQEIGTRGASVIAGTADATYPFWSPDGEYVAFFARGKLMKVRAAGGTPQALAPVSAAPRGGSWGSRNVIVYTFDAGGPLWQVNADGSNRRVLTEKIFQSAEASHRWPVFLPDGNHFLFWGGNFAKNDTQSGIYMSSLDKLEKKLVVQGHTNIGFALPGYLFYVGDKSELLIQPFDSASGQVRGEPHVLQETVGFQPQVYWGAFTVSENGTVVSNSSAATARSVLTWFDRTGKAAGTVGEAGTIANPALSPDGSKVALDIADLRTLNVDIWIQDMNRGTSTRFSFDPAEDSSPIWSPDGTKIAYRTQLDRSAMQLKAASGLEKERVIAAQPNNGEDFIPNSWSPDGQYIVGSLQGAGGTHLAIVKVGVDETKPLNTSKGNENNGQVSRDGKWLAYASDESGEWEIYVTSFPGTTGKWQVSQGGGTEPRWRRDGKELFYINAKGTLMSVQVNTEGGFSTATPAEMFPLGGRAAISSSDLFTYDVAPDGQRFLVNRYTKPAFLPPLDIVLNATK